LEITNLGAMDVTGLGLGSSLKSYTYSNGTFELLGLASPSATISINIDEVIQTATADDTGLWSTLVSSLTEGQHQFNLSSGEETLDFVLTVGLSNWNGTVNEATEGATGTLPAAGSISASILFFAFALLSVGLGLVLTKQT